MVPNDLLENFKGYFDHILGIKKKLSVPIEPPRPIQQAPPAHHAHYAQTPGPGGYGPGQGQYSGPPPPGMFLFSFH